MGILKHSGPLHPQYATVEARLRTFREWPPALRQQPKELADAGFYYIGLSDQVKCFYCDGGLRNWQQDDEPWKEHARWFNKCVFVRLVKGDGYIQQCLLERPPESAALQSQSGPRAVTEEEVRRAMSAAIVKQVLSMGIDHSRVKMAIKKRLESSGNPFDTTESLISAAFSVQRSQERRSHRENLNPSGAVLGGLTESVSRSRGDTVTERWVVGQAASEGGDEDMEEAQSQGNTISLTREDPGPAAATISSPTAAAAALPAQQQPPSGSASAPSSPSVEMAAVDEKFQSMPLLGEEKETKNVDLESENARLKEQRTCKICMDGEVSRLIENKFFVEILKYSLQVGVVFLPCGHLCCCVNCAPALKVTSLKTTAKVMTYIYLHFSGLSCLQTKYSGNCTNVFVMKICKYVKMSLILLLFNQKI